MLFANWVMWLLFTFPRTPSPQQSFRLRSPFQPCTSRWWWRKKLFDCRSLWKGDFSNVTDFLKSEHTTSELTCKFQSLTVSFKASPQKICFQTHRVTDVLSSLPPSKPLSLFCYRGFQSLFALLTFKHLCNPQSASQGACTDARGHHWARSEVLSHHVSFYQEAVFK